MQLKKLIKQCVAAMVAIVMLMTSVQFGVDVNAAGRIIQPLGANVALGAKMLLPKEAYTIKGNTAATKEKKDSAAKIFDGNLKEGFQAVDTEGKNDPQAWIIDLKESFSIDMIKLYWENAARAVNYDIYVSDAESENTDEWTLIGEIKNGQEQLTHKFEATKARYVKLDLKTKIANWGYHLYEAEVYTVGTTELAVTENLSLKATATASSYDNAETMAQKAIDGNPATIWRAPMDKKDENGAFVKDEYDQNIPLTDEEKSQEYITLEWEQEETFSVVTAVWDNGYLKGYKLQISDDGNQWTDIYEVSDGEKAETRRMELNKSVTTKYLRLQGTEIGAYRAELKELQVYDETSIPVEKLLINADSIQLNMDDKSALSVQMEVKVVPSNAANKEVIWETADSSVATVDENGFITAVKPGITMITASSVSNPDIKAECQVAVASSLDKPQITAGKMEGKKDITVSWSNVENAAGYEVYRVNAKGKETKVYEGNNLICMDTSLQPDTYCYYVLAKAPENSAIYSDSKSNLTDGILIPVDVEGVEISNNAVNLFVGDSMRLTATIAPLNATNTAVTWISSNEDVVSIDENGNLEALKEGQATITATTVEGGFTATSTINVAPVDATSIVLNEETKIVEYGDTFQIEAKINPIDTTYKDITWKSADRTIATVDENGVVTAKKVGRTIITATTVSGVTAECEIIVKITPTDVTLNQTEIELYEGKTTILSATVVPANATDGTIRWLSDNTAVATVDENGNVTALSAGRADITVITNDGNQRAVCTVIVKKEVVPTTTNKPVVTTQQVTTTQAETVKTPAKAKISKVTAKKMTAKKVKLILKKISGAKGYEVQILTSKNAKKAFVKKIVKRVKVTVSSSKLKNKKKLYVRVRAYVFNTENKKVYGKWSTVKKIKIKKN